MDETSVSLQLFLVHGPAPSQGNHMRIPDDRKVQLRAGPYAAGNPCRERCDPPGLTSGRAFFLC